MKKTITFIFVIILLSSFVLAESTDSCSNTLTFSDGQIQKVIINEKTHQIKAHIESEGGSENAWASFSVDDDFGVWGKYFTQGWGNVLMPAENIKGVDSKIEINGVQISLIAVGYDQNKNEYAKICVSAPTPTQTSLCQVGSYRCEKDQSGQYTNQAQKCYDSSKGWTNVELCNNGCDSSTGQCKSSVNLCDAGKYRCEKNTEGQYTGWAQKCSDSSKGWINAVYCNSGCDGLTGQCNLAQISDCTDSDGSPDFMEVYKINSIPTEDITFEKNPSLYEKGIGKGSYGEGNFTIGRDTTKVFEETAEPYTTYYDYCSNAKQLNEAYCRKGKLMSIAIFCPAGCNDGVCLKSQEDMITKIKEEIACVFENSDSIQKCYSPDGKYSCSGIESCSVTILDQKNTKISWESSCQNNPTTIVDGIHEKIEFKCKTVKEDPQSTTTSSPNDSAPTTAVKLDKEKLQAPECNGCNKDSACLPFGNRQGGKYCDVDKTFKDEKESGTCDNSYECTSNLCINNECVAPSLWKRILAWFGFLN